MYMYMHWVTSNRFEPLPSELLGCLCAGAPPSSPH